jgi:hypothetical protein
MKTLLIALTFLSIGAMTAGAEAACCKQGDHMSCGSPPLHCDEEFTGNDNSENSELPELRCSHSAPNHMTGSYSSQCCTYLHGVLQSCGPVVDHP